MASQSLTVLSPLPVAIWPPSGEYVTLHIIPVCPSRERQRAGFGIPELNRIVITSRGDLVTSANTYTSNAICMPLKGGEQRAVSIPELDHVVFTSRGDLRHPAVRRTSYPVCMPSREESRRRLAFQSLTSCQNFPWRSGRHPAIRHTPYSTCMPLKEAARRLASQSLTVLSPLPVAIWPPSGEYVTLCTQSVCPSREESSAPDLASELDRLVRTSRGDLAASEYVTLNIGPVCPSREESSAPVGIPELDRLIVTSRGDLAAIRRNTSHYSHQMYAPQGGGKRAVVSRA